MLLLNISVELSYLGCHDNDLSFQRHLFAALTGQGESEIYQL